jgi:hypothetical protein
MKLKMKINNMVSLLIMQDLIAMLEVKVTLQLVEAQNKDTTFLKTVNSKSPKKLRSSL